MKWLSVILLSAALALFCPACGDDDNAGEGPQTQSPADVDSPTNATQTPDDLGLQIDPDKEHATFEDNLMINAVFNRRGIHYNIEFLDLLDQHGLIAPGQAEVFDLLGLLQLSVNVEYADNYDVLAGFELSGLWKFQEYGSVPNGEYGFYWGTDPWNLPPESGDMLQVVLWLNRDSVEVRAKSVLEYIEFDVQDVIEVDGGSVGVALDECAEISLLAWGMGLESKHLELRMDDRCWSFDYNVKMEMPNSIVAMRWNPYNW